LTNLIKILEAFDSTLTSSAFTKKHPAECTQATEFFHWKRSQF